MTRRHVALRTALACAAALPLAARPAGAQAADTVPLTKLVQLSIPTTPALDFIGANPDEVTRPITPKALAAALLSGVGPGGRVQQGFALEVAPGQLLRPDMDLREYQRATGFLLSNLSLSAGAAKASGEASATDLAVGLRAVLLDRTDPLGPASRAAGDAAIQRALLGCLPRDAQGRPVPVRGDTAVIRRVRACVAAEDSTFRERWREERWNDWAVSLSLASGWRLNDSEWSDRSGLGVGAAAVAAAPLCLRAGVRGLCSAGQWLVKLGYEDRELADAASRRQLTAGVRTSVGTSAFAVFAEHLTLRRLSPPAGVRRRRTAWSAGVEFPVGEHLWASTGLGERYEELEDDGKVVVLAGLRFNVGEKRRLSTVVPLPR